VVSSLSEQEQRIVGFVESDGCFINSVFDPDGVEPDFAYSIGFPASLDQPDALISGLKLDLMSVLINDLYALCRDGLRMDDFRRTDRLLTGFECVFREISSENLAANFLSSAVWFQETYRGEKFESAFQIVWPDEHGKFPWEAGFDEDTGGGQLSLWEGGSLH